MSDMISREAALEAIDRERGFLIENKMYGAEHVVVHHARRIIEDLPSVEAIPIEWLISKCDNILEESENFGELLQYIGRMTVIVVQCLIDMWKHEMEPKCVLPGETQMQEV